MDRTANTQAPMRIASTQLTLGRKIGVGGLSNVYRAKYHSAAVDEPELTVAVKRLNTDADPTLEAKLIQAARHKYVIKLHGYVNDDAYRGLVLELCSSGDLESYLHDTDLTLDMSKKARELIALDIIKGITFLHASGIIHRDIKSPNILLKSVKTSEGQGRLLAKITDFGLAIQLEPGTTEYITDRRQGTPGWLAPEGYILNQEKQRYVCTAKVDIFAFGMLLNLLAREDEFTPLPHIQSVVLVMAFVANNGLAGIELPGDYSSATTRALVRRCWSLDQSQRPDAKEILDSFKAGNGLFPKPQ